MRILVVSNLFPPAAIGGYELLCADVVESLSARGHEVEVLTTVAADAPRASGVRRLLELWQPFDEPPRPSRWRRLGCGRRNARAMSATLERFAPDVVFCWSLRRLGPDCPREASRRGYPVVYTFNDVYPLHFRPVDAGSSVRRTIRAVAERTVLRSITAGDLDFSFSTCISESLRRELADGWGRLGASQVIYQGIPVQRFPCKGDPGSIGDPMRLVYAGQLHRYKGVHTALAALAQLRAPATLSVIGAGDTEYERFLRSEAARLGVSQRVSFTGRVPRAELPARLREHDVLLFTSEWAEPFGLTHLEAMASGTTVISTTCGGPGELVREGDNALTFAAGDAQQLAAQISRLSRSPQLSRRIARRARDVVLRDFSLDSYVGQLEELLGHASSPLRAPDRASLRR